MEDWHIPYMPTPAESMDHYINRITNLPEILSEDMNLVLMEQQPDDLAIIGRAQYLLGTRHKFEPGYYCVMAIRDLIFCAYTRQWAAR